jgi:hypothetical protein
VAVQSIDRWFDGDAGTIAKLALHSKLVMVAGEKMIGRTRF